MCLIIFAQNEDKSSESYHHLYKYELFNIWVYEGEFNTLSTGLQTINENQVPYSELIQPQDSHVMTIDEYCGNDKQIKSLYFTDGTNYWRCLITSSSLNNNPSKMIFDGYILK